MLIGVDFWVIEGRRDMFSSGECRDTVYMVTQDIGVWMEDLDGLDLAGSPTVRHPCCRTTPEEKSRSHHTSDHIERHK